MQSHGIRNIPVVSNGLVIEYAYYVDVKSVCIDGFEAVKARPGTAMAI